MEASTRAVKKAGSATITGLFVFGMAFWAFVCSSAFERDQALKDIGIFVLFCGLVWSLAMIAKIMFKQ
jgi:hypothetical protein